MLETLRQPKRRPAVIGPEDHGRAMSLEQFDRATAREGHLYELNKGVIEVSDIPSPAHLTQVNAVRDQIILYQHAHPGIVHTVADGSGSKLLIGPSRSERHPDLTVYLTPPPDSPEIWSLWIPAIVVEVVSPSSKKRDYEEKPAEYLEFGVTEYWIVDSIKRCMTVLYRWRGQWKQTVLTPTQKYTTHLVPGLSLDLKRVLRS